MLSSPLPRQGRLLGVDFGHVRLGLAICDPQQSLASPLQNYTRRSDSADATYLRQLIAEEGVVGIVVGLPVHMSGDESAKSREARQFADWLAQVTGLPVDMFDERYSSAAADDYMLEAGLTPKQRKKRRDMLSAQVILSGYLQSPLPGSPPGAID